MAILKSTAIDNAQKQPNFKSASNSRKPNTWQAGEPSKRFAPLTPLFVSPQEDPWPENPQRDWLFFFTCWGMLQVIHWILVTPQNFLQQNYQIAQQVISGQQGFWANSQAVPPATLLIYMFMVAAGQSIKDFSQNIAILGMLADGLVAFWLGQAIAKLPNGRGVGRVTGPLVWMSIAFATTPTTMQTPLAWSSLLAMAAVLYLQEGKGLQADLAVAGGLLMHLGFYPILPLYLARRSYDLWQSHGHSIQAFAMRLFFCLLTVLSGSIVWIIGCYNNGQSAVIQQTLFSQGVLRIDAALGGLVSSICNLLQQPIPLVSDQLGPHLQNNWVVAFLPWLTPAIYTIAFALSAFYLWQRYQWTQAHQAMAADLPITNESNHATANFTKKLDRFFYQVLLAIICCSWCLIPSGINTAMLVLGPVIIYCLWQIAGKQGKDLALAFMMIVALGGAIQQFYGINLARLENMGLALHWTQTALLFLVTALSVVQVFQSKKHFFSLEKSMTAFVAKKLDKTWTVEQIIGLASLVVLFLWIFISSLSETTTNDIFIQIKAGEDILQTGQVPYTEVYSATVYGRPFIAHEWLSSVIFALITRPPMGGAGLSLLTAITAFIAGIMLYFAGPASMRRHFWYQPVFVLSFYLVSFRVLARPHLFTMMVYCALMLTLECWRRKGDIKYLLPLLPMQIIWVNLHGAAPFGPAFFGFLTILVAFMVLVPITQQRGAESRIFTWKDVFQLAGITVALCLAFLINPYGLKLLTFSIDLMQNAYAKNRVWEWTTPFLDSNWRYYWLWLYITMLVFLWSGLLFRIKTLPVIDFAIAGLMTFFSVRANRFVPDIATLVLPILLRSSLYFVQRLKIPTEIGRLARYGQVTMFGLSVMLLAQAVTYGYAHSAHEHRPMFGWGFGGDMPYQEVDFLKAIHAKGNIFNEYSDGALIIKELTPQIRPVLDSRIDLYPVNLVMEYDYAYIMPEYFQKYADKNRVNYVLFIRYRAQNSRVPAYLDQSPDWEKILDTQARMLYRRRKKVS